MSTMDAAIENKRASDSSSATESNRSSTAEEEKKEDEEEKRKSLYNRRKNIILEILQTERSYVNNLQVVVEVYMNPLRQDEQWKNLLTEDQFKTIFSDTEVILKYNMVFFEQLDKRVGNNFDPQTIKLGDIFIMISDYLKVYTRYVNNYNDAHWAVKGLIEDSKDFVKFIQICRSNPRCESRDIDDFLIMPVQRIPRYNLLLIDLVKNTPPDHPDYGQLVKAKEKIADIASFVNEQKRVVENLAKVGDIIACITGLDVKFKLLSPTRRFIREGKLQQVLQDSQQIEKKNFYFFLFNDLLIWSKKKTKVYEFRQLAYLSDLDIRLGFSENRTGIGFRYEGKSVVLLDKTDEETESWFNDFVAARAEILEKESFKKIEKRKTFVHEELAQTVSQEGKLLKKPAAFAKFFRISDKKEQDPSAPKEEKKSEKSDKNTERPEKNPRFSKEKAMTIAVKKSDLMGVQLRSREKRRSIDKVTDLESSVPVSTGGPTEKELEDMLRRGRSQTNLTNPNRPSPIRNLPNTIQRSGSSTAVMGSPNLKSSGTVKENPQPITPVKSGQPLLAVPTNKSLVSSAKPPLPTSPLPSTPLKESGSGTATPTGPTSPVPQHHPPLPSHPPPRRPPNSLPPSAPPSAPNSRPSSTTVPKEAIIEQESPDRPDRPDRPALLRAESKGTSFFNNLNSKLSNLMPKEKEKESDIVISAPVLVAKTTPPLASLEKQLIEKQLGDKPPMQLPNAISGLKPTQPKPRTVGNGKAAERQDGSEPSSASPSPYKSNPISDASKGNF